MKHTHIYISIFILFFTSLFYTSCQYTTKNQNDEVCVQDTIEQQLSLLYGIDKDAYTIEKSAVIRNKNLSDILAETGLTRQQIYTISVKLDTIFDVRKIRSGNTCVCFYN
ncbi:MAG TPA: hypothetical protein PLU45_04015, partial [Bacteroidales bacterium]|nr:hypothetical protein [Bacteroidales bacterium]